VCRWSGFDLLSGQAQLWLPSLRGRQNKNEEQLVYRWVTTTDDCGVEACGCEMVTYWLMQPVVQTTTRGMLAISADALEVLLHYIWRFKSGHTLTKVQFIYQSTTVHDLAPPYLSSSLHRVADINSICRLRSSADTNVLLQYPFSATVLIGYRWLSLVSGHWTTNMEQFTSVNTLCTVSAVI